MNSRTLCLGILHFQDATGYEINKMASDGNFSHFIEASYGSIYPALTRLTKEGLLTWREEQVPGNPTRKVYAITPEGREALRDALLETPKWDVFKSEFLFLNLFSDILPEKHLQKMCARRADELRAELDRLDEAQASCDHPGSQFAIGYGQALTRAALEYLENSLASAIPPKTTVAAE